MSHDARYESLAQALQYFTTTWQLDMLQPLEPSSFTHNYVTVAYSHQLHTKVVLKICPDGIDGEQRALHYFQPYQCVTLLAYDIPSHGMLLAYVQPGITLKSYFPDRENESLDIFADLVKSYTTGAADTLDQVHNFPTIHDWLKILNTHVSTVIPQPLLTQAWDMAQHLLATQTTTYVLHGDLHHENILQQEKSWVMIDPQGVVGEVAYELCGAFIRNPIPLLLEQHNAHDIVAHRIGRLSEICGCDYDRMIQWAFVQAILAGCWAEENGRPISRDGYYIRFATLISNIANLTY